MGARGREGEGGEGGGGRGTAGSFKAALVVYIGPGLLTPHCAWMYKRGITKRHMDDKE